MMNIKTQIFCRALPIISQLLADKCGVKVIFGGEVPYTNGKSIVIPKVRCATRQEEIDVLGSIIHEAGHIRFTDFVMTKALSNLQFELTNALEDPRIEKLMCRQFFGAYDYFETSFKFSIESNLLDVIPKTDPNDLLCLYCLLRAHSEIQGDKYTEKVFRVADRRMTQLAGAQLKQKLDKLIDQEFPLCSNTEQIQELAIKIANLLGAQQSIGQKQSSQSSPSQGRQADGSKDQGQQSQGSPSQGQQADASKDQGQQSQGSQNQGSTTSSGGNALQEQSNNQSNSQPEEKALNAWNMANESQIPVKCSWNSDEHFRKICALDADFENELEKLTTFSSSNLISNPLDLNALFKCNNAAQDLENGQKLLEEARSESAGLSRALQKLLIQNQIRKVWLSRSGMRVNGAALARLSVGNTKVFHHQHEVRGVSTAVHLLLDGSGSMGGDDFKLGIKASLAIGSVLENMRQVSWGLTLFQDEQPKVLIRHGERIKKKLGYLGGCRKKGATPMYPALIAGGYQLYQRAEERKVLIVITDLEEFDNVCKNTVEDLTKAGILVVGIIVGDSPRSQNVAEAFEYSSRIKQMGELNTALFNIATKIFY